MKREFMKILEHTSIANDTYRLLLEGEMVQDIVDPGQFVHVQISDDFYLRRPVSICDYNRSEGTMTLLYKVMGKGTDALTKKEAGGFLDVLGPGGQGFPLPGDEQTHALLIGGGIGVPPLYNLAKQLNDKGIRVTSVLGFQTKADAFLIEEFESFGEVYVSTNDGTLGTKGFVTDVLSQLESVHDTYYACGPTVMLKAVMDQLEEVPGYISMEERMGCGIGACFACVIESRDDKGYKRICCDGPVFDAKEVVLS
ncbi:dihydroorotate dehydrogenase electron transfer subunit [Halobacillus litoralis]|uniref:dihydroorotate dehydrogenase electron transfer subunit n=1 Tax=Halobacillus litoralis TaxID=45668 RepID=UPI001CFC52C5|nr:dihydroorotate dehydrogenase electron transfer subunit [Halobacillus litoralis]